MRGHAHAHVPSVACVKIPLPQGTELLDNSPQDPLRTAVQPLWDRRPAAYRTGVAVIIHVEYLQI